MDIDYQIIRASPDAPDFEERILPIIQCDREVYGTDPSWREGNTCRDCSRASDGPVKWLFAEAPKRCPVCDAPTTDFWSVEELLTDYRIDSARDNYAFVAAYDGPRVVGSFRGWSMMPGELDHHLSAGIEKRLWAMPSIAEALQTRFPEAVEFAYESSIFVLPAYQGRGIGKHLTQLGQQLLWDSGLRAFVMRTKTFPPAVTYPWYANRLGYELLSSYPDADHRVILARAHHERP